MFKNGLILDLPMPLNVLFFCVTNFLINLIIKTSYEKGRFGR